MAFDAHKNLAISTVVTPPAPATSGTTLSVTAGEGGRFPAPPFNVTIWPASQPPTPLNAEVARVTATAGDGLTLVRSQEGSIARSIIAGDLIAATITAKALTDVESGTNFPLITTPGAVTFTGPVGYVHMNTNDGADNAILQLSASNGSGVDRGATINMFGNEASDPGALAFYCGPTGKISFVPGPTTKGVMYPSGGFCWGAGAPIDPGAGVIHVGTMPTGAGNTYANIGPGWVFLGNAGTGQVGVMRFNNANGEVGYIATAGASTNYSTTSDARLKTDRGLITDPEVLRATRVHHFTWTTDGTVGRGVFAQEALAVLPAAVSIGTDERDDAGRLIQPWAVDYSKYVPDLIAGWQHHDHRFDAMANRVAFLEGAIVTMRERAGRPTLINRIRTAIRSFGQWWMPSWV